MVLAKRQIKDLFAKLTELSDDPSKPFLDRHLCQVIADNFGFKKSELFSQLSMQAPTWRLFHALFDYLTSEHLQQLLPEPESVFNQQARVRA